MGVAVFVFFFGIFFPLVDYVSMWWTVTMAIYIGGAGAIIIGGLYWKKATTRGRLVEPDIRVSSRRWGNCRPNNATARNFR